MSNPNYPVTRQQAQVQAQYGTQTQYGTLPPCPELRDVRYAGLADEEDRWYPNLDAATEEALSRGHSQGLAGSGGMLPENLDRFGWGHRLAGSGTVVHHPNAGGHAAHPGQHLSGGHPAAGGYPAYLPNGGYPTGGHACASNHPQGGSNPHGIVYPSESGRSRGGYSPQGGSSRRA